MNVKITHTCQAILQSWHCQRNDVNQNTDFVLPLYIGDDDDEIELISPSSGILRYGCNRAIEYLEGLVDNAGLRAVILSPAWQHSQVRKFEPTKEFPYRDLSTCSQSQSSSSSNSYIADDETQGPLSDININNIKIETGSQNPFLAIDQNDDEEKHLIDDQLDTIVEASLSVATGLPIIPQRSGPVNVKQAPPELNCISRLLPKLRQRFPNLLIICDISSSSMPSGEVQPIVIEPDPKEQLLGSQSWPSDRVETSLAVPVKLAIHYANLGCDIVAFDSLPSNLIAELKLRQPNLQIMINSINFRSSFQDTRDTSGGQVERLPVGSRSLAVQTAKKTIDGGCADFVMIKPSISYLDIVRDISELQPQVPIAIYQTLTEYSMLKIAAESNIVASLSELVNEMLTSYRRAGASIIITHFAPAILANEL